MAALHGPVQRARSRERIEPVRTGIDSPRSGKLWIFPAETPWVTSHTTRACRWAGVDDSVSPCRI